MSIQFNSEPLEATLIATSLSLFLWNANFTQGTDLKLKKCSYSIAYVEPT